MSQLKLEKNIWLEILSYLESDKDNYYLLRLANLIPIIYHTNYYISYSEILFNKNNSQWNFRYHDKPIPLEFNDFSLPQLIENNYESKIEESNKIIEYSIEESKEIIEPSVKINSSGYRKKVYKKGGKLNSRKSKKSKKIKKKKREESDKFLKKKKERKKKRKNERNNNEIFDINLPNEIGKIYFYKGKIYSNCYYESSYVYSESYDEDLESYDIIYDFDMSPDEYESYLYEEKMDRANYRRRRYRRRRYR